MGTSNLSLRSRVTVDDDELIKTIEYAHSINKKVYAALNIYARDNMYEEIENQINILNFIYVLFVLGTHDDFLDSGTFGCQYLLLDATHRKHFAAKSDFSRHGNVGFHFSLSQGRSQ